MVMSDEQGVRFWKIYVHAITVYVDSVTHYARCGPLWVAKHCVPDCGALPLIITTSEIANGIYFAGFISAQAQDMKLWVEFAPKYKQQSCERLVFSSGTADNTRSSSA